MSNLREIIEEAINQIDTFKYPNVSEAQERINELLKAGGLGSTGEDRIRHLSISRGLVEIGTIYSVRQCTQTDDYEFPEWIIDAPDPVQAIRKWGREKEIAKLEREVAEKRRDYEAAQTRLAAKLNEPVVKS
ncbi:hypothetical protein [Mesorhizobium sp.]|uniref:hypothetical protein n=1 Tax=Mesorhizobium sp. TaxID=1871066 RepID=UPI000FE41C32|nr:hypothetical protein [Mesorhizobium sp.]RWJ03415.1 MAG: hypothetical protein EOR24_32050 [Mesorhizobium sp.]